jgi:hypothetical protein
MSPHRDEEYADYESPSRNGHTEYRSSKEHKIKSGTITSDRKISREMKITLYIWK